MIGLMLLALLGGTLAQAAMSPAPAQHSCDVTMNPGSHGMPCKPMPSEPGMPACVAAIGCMIAVPVPELPSVALRSTPAWYAAPPDGRAGRSTEPDPFPPKLVA